MRFIFVLLLFISSYFLSAQQSLLWEVKSTNGNVSYLFGTFHVAQHFPKDREVQLWELMEMTNGLIVEADMTDSTEDRMDQIIKASVMRDTTLRALIGYSLFDDITFKLQEITGLPAGFFDYHKPMLAALFLSNDYLAGSNGMEQGYSMDINLQKRALMQNKLKPIIGLETMLDQSNYLFNDIPLNEQVQMLKESFTPKENQPEFEKLKKWYSEEITDSLYWLSNSMPPISRKVLLDGRNQLWIKKLEPLLKKDTYLIAVGAMHLFGTNGLIQLFRNSGFTVTPL